MKFIQTILVLCVLSCETSTDVSYVSNHLLTASGVRPLVVVENHDALSNLSKKKLDGTLAGTDSGRQMLTLLVACALGPQETLTVSADGEDLEFFGEAGLAPEWATRSLKDDSKGWVSACVLSHLSLSGLPAVISMRGRKAVLRPDNDERTGWPLEEGAFFGNIFTPGSIQWFACLGRDHVPSGVERSCAQQDPAHMNSTLCGLTFVGDCADVCKWNNDVCRVAGTPFREVITVRLQR